MRILAGLGNPGAKYAENRHNIGFMAVDRIAADHGFPPWKARWQGLASEGRLGNTRVILLKPQQFMNLSGQAVGEAMRYLKLGPADITVFHDELDLAPGKLRLKQGGGHAGHNGLRSIHQHIGEDYQRVRLGIGHPGRKELVTSHVLGNFAKADQDWLEALLDAVAYAAPALAEGDAARFQNEVAARMHPQHPPKSAPANTKPKTEAPAPSADDSPPSMSSRLASLARRFGP